MVGMGVSKGFRLHVEDHPLPLLLTFCVNLGKSPSKFIATVLIFCMCGLLISAFLFMSYLFAVLAPQGED